MRSHVPKVSIGMPVFNGANFLRHSLRSLLEQDFDDFELIISDNGSTDETEAICRELAAVDRRIRYYRNKDNIGAARNYNRVFQLARGQFFKWAAHDDECHPALLRRCVETLERAPASVVMVYPLGELIDEQGKVLEPVLDRIASNDSRPHRRLAHLLWSLNMCDPVFGLYRVEHLKKSGLIGPFCGADYVMLGELTMMGPIMELNEVLFRLRAHARRSMQANDTARARTTWYDPSAASRLFVLPDWEQMVWAMMRSACRADLPLGEKLKCCLAVPGVHYWRRFRTAGGRVKRRLFAGLRSATAPAARRTL
jgi:glycosyltransferase involved in cell wall biosynthesis